jgi:MFS family permease
VFWVASVLSALAALQLHWRAHEERIVVLADAPPVWRGFVTALRGLLAQRAIAWLLLLVLRLGSNMLDPLLALVVRDLGALSCLSETPALALERTIAIPFGMLAFAQLFFTRRWGRMADRHGPLRCLAMLALGLGLTHLLSAQAASIEAFLGVRVLTTCLMAGSLTLAYSAVSKRVADTSRTLAFASIQSCIQFGLSLGPLLGAAVAATADGVAYRRAFVLAGVLCAIAGVGLWVLRVVTARPVGSAGAGAEAGCGDGPP